MSAELIDFVLHFDTHIFSWAEILGPWLYVFLFLIVFCETGLVVTPFLPGDSLLFSLGSVCALRPDLLSLKVLGLLLVLAAILGDALNFTLGHFFRTRWLYAGGKWRLINEKHIKQAEIFYQKYGGMAIFLGRFLPIIRTYVPFVAGMSLMSRRKFTVYNVIGGVIWISLFLLLGYFFGGFEIVKQNFTAVVLGIIVLSFVPVFYELTKKWFFPLKLSEKGENEKKILSFK